MPNSHKVVQAEKQTAESQYPQRICPDAPVLEIPGGSKSARWASQGNQSMRKTIFGQTCSHTPISYIVRTIAFRFLLQGRLHRIAWSKWQARETTIKAGEEPDDQNWSRAEGRNFKAGVDARGDDYSGGHAERRNSNVTWNFEKGGVDVSWKIAGRQYFTIGGSSLGHIISARDVAGRHTKPPGSTTQ